MPEFLEELINEMPFLIYFVGISFIFLLLAWVTEKVVFKTKWWKKILEIFESLTQSF